MRVINLGRSSKLDRLAGVMCITPAAVPKTATTHLAQCHSRKLRLPRQYIEGKAQWKAADDKIINYTLNR